MDLDRLKYSEMQKLAKDAGIRANMKSDKLKKALQEYYSTQACQKEKKTATPTYLTQTVGSAERRGRHKRRGTYDLDDDKDVSFLVRSTDVSDESSRRSTEEIIGGMDATADDESMKQAFLDVINRKVQFGLKTTTGTSALSKIPRFTQITSQKDQASITPGNKNWAAIHKRNFDKMDSIDVYLEKKRKRTEALQSSTLLSDTLTKTHAAIEKQRNYRTPDVVRKSVQKKGATKSKLFTTPAAQFQPTVLSTKEINVNFAGIKSPGFRFAGASRIVKPVLPQRRSPRASMRENIATSIPKLNRPKKSSLMSPGKGVPEPKSARKSTFDLQASLSRPLTWLPYTGKIKPLEAVKTSAHDANGGRRGKTSRLHAAASQTAETRKFFKTPTLKNTKETRRTDATKARSDKQFAERMKRRGIKA